MRCIGMAERAFEIMCKHANVRETRGQKLADFQFVQEWVATSRMEIEQARLLTLQAADQMDRYGSKEARDLIGMIKVVAPSMAQAVIDWAIQAHGGLGFCQDTVLPRHFTSARTLRIADGPDQVHLYSLARQILKRYGPEQ